MKSIASFDVDMTLLDHKDWMIPDSAMETIEKLREKYIIVVATGRDMDSHYSTAIRDQINPDAIIHSNGTKITVGEDIIYHHTFDKDLLSRILAYGENNKFSLGASVGELDYYTNPENVKRHDEDLWGECMRRFADPAKLLSLPVGTLAYIGNDHGADKLRKEFPQIQVHMFAERRGGDVVEKEASKATGLQRLCEYYGIPMKNTVAFGDSMNDYDIVKAAGIGIAMGNAMEELKRAADYVTDSIDQHGIRNACIRFGMI